MSLNTFILRAYRAVAQVGQADVYEDDAALHENPGGDYSEQAMAKAALRS